jgi:transcriptional regulator with GAF, ATPase, and Fis domain
LTITLGGTLFLDEIGDMGLSCQARILRVLQDQELRRPGGKETFKVDVRFIAATNRTLDLLVGEGKFRNDLMYCLNAAALYLPPLRERKEDIIPLVRRFIVDYGLENKRPEHKLEQLVIDILSDYDWPAMCGNLRGYFLCLYGGRRNSPADF